MINVRNLEFAYREKSGGFFRRGQEVIFTGAGISLPGGCICGLLGPNGAGKTTLLKLMAGLLFPHSGDISIKGFTPAERDPDFLQDVFFLPEEFHTPSLKARQYGERYGALYPRFDQLYFLSLLQKFGLPADKPLNALSHGQRKKAMLSFGLATRASLVILDEPSNGMDIPSKSQFREVLLENFDENSTVIISTHQVHDLEGLIDTVSILANGRILLSRTLDDIADKLAFEHALTAPETALFSEKSIGGCAYVKRNDEGLATKVDLSLLFGLVTQQTALVQSLFNTTGNTTGNDLGNQAGNEGVRQ